MTTKYIVRTYHGDAFMITFEPSKKVFFEQLEAQKDYAKIEEIEANAEPNDRGEYYNTEFEEGDGYTQTSHIFGAGTSETRFIELKAKEGYTIG